MALMLLVLFGLAILVASVVSTQMFDKGYKETGCFILVLSLAVLAMVMVVANGR